MKAKPHIIAISSHVAYGAVGNRIIVPILEKLGLQVTAVPTIQLSWHPGMNAKFGHGARITPDEAAFDAMIKSLAGAPWLGGVSGIITGYLGNAAQAKTIAGLVSALKTANPDAIYLCDPVTGDHGGLYVPEPTATAIRENLWQIADIVTPNLFEFQWMTGSAANSEEPLKAAARALNKRTVVITSVEAGDGLIGNLWVEPQQSALVTHAIARPAPNGTGDMLAAVFFGNCIKGFKANVALEMADAAVFAAIRHSIKHRTDSLDLGQVEF